MLNLLNNLLDANKRTLNRYAEVVAQINSLEEEIQKLTNQQLKERSLKLKERVNKGESLNDILVEAFALVREAAKRAVKMRHFDVQLMAALALHEGKIAEQKTGEGKTLSAAPAAYLNALTGKGVHIVTVNDYLARRDCGWMGPIYHLLGLSCATIIHEQSFLYDPEYDNRESSDERLRHLRPISRKEAYQADITYGTNNEFGFDYLRDNMAYSLVSTNQREHNYAIVDEVDSILIDEARTPLIISAPAQEPTEKYIEFAKLVEKLSPQLDYVVDEKQRTAHLTEAGIVRVEKMLGVDNLYEKDFSTLHHIEEALKAKTLFQKDRDYVVKDGQVIIVDEFTGRLMPGRRYSEGLHQAIEAKEGVPIQQESQTLATISFQNYFRMYQKLAGMTGTAATEAEEFHKIYKLDVVVIPTHKPMIRKDYPDAIYKTQAAKYTAVADEIAKVHATGRPILVGTTSIEKNEFLSELLKRKRISHAVLNAKNHEKEAEIIARAGEKGAVTVATNMAGRGVDIKLGEGVAELGGLYVIGTERHESRRIDNQLRGRAGRQGDPGSSKFFVSLEDDLMRIFGGEQIAKVMSILKMPDNVPIENSLVSKAIESAQKKVEGYNFDIRKHTVEYDDVMNQQRKIIYGLRRRILEMMESGSEDIKQEILKKVETGIEQLVTANSQEVINHDRIVEEFCTIIPFDQESQKSIRKEVGKIESVEGISSLLTKIAKDAYEEKEKRVGREQMRQIEGFVYLNTIDTLWVEHLDTIDDLRVGIGLRAYGQKDPLVEYKREAYDLFERLIANIDAALVQRIYKVELSQAPQVVMPTGAVERHDESLDHDLLREGMGELISGVDRLEVDQQPVVSNLSSPDTKVIIKKDGRVISESMYSSSTNPSSSQLHNPRKKLGRNDPCWCGSGKKYKKCHYPN